MQFGIAIQHIFRYETHILSLSLINATDNVRDAKGLSMRPEEHAAPNSEIKNNNKKNSNLKKFQNRINLFLYFDKKNFS